MFLKVFKLIEFTHLPSVCSLLTYKLVVIILIINSNFFTSFMLLFASATVQSKYMYLQDLPSELYAGVYLCFMISSTNAIYFILSPILNLLLHSVIKFSSRFFFFVYYSKFIEKNNEFSTSFLLQPHPVVGALLLYRCGCLYSEREKSCALFCLFL